MPQIPHPLHCLSLGRLAASKFAHSDVPLSAVRTILIAYIDAYRHQDVMKPWRDDIKFESRQNYV
jgi:hypothetical protein